MKKCNYCGDELPKSSLRFCDIDCEELFREENSEFVAKMKDGTYENICPVVDFIDNEDGFITVNNGSYDYTFNKDNIEKYGIMPCSCLSEFIETDCHKIDDNWSW